MWRINRVHFVLYRERVHTYTLALLPLHYSVENYVQEVFTICKLDVSLECCEQSRETYQNVRDTDKHSERANVLL
jgi:hypothetical protein